MQACRPADTEGKPSDEKHLALRVHAAKHRQSMEAEVREILESAIRHQAGSLLADVGRQARLSDEEFAVFERVHDKMPYRPS